MNRRCLSRPLLSLLAIVPVLLDSSPSHGSAVPDVLAPVCSVDDDAIVEAVDPDPEGKGTAGDPLQGLWKHNIHGKPRDPDQRDDRRPLEGEDAKHPILDSDSRPGARYDEGQGRRLTSRSYAEEGEPYGSRGRAGSYESNRGAAGMNDSEPGAAGDDDYRRGAAGYGGEDD